MGINRDAQINIRNKQQHATTMMNQPQRVKQQAWPSPIRIRHHPLSPLHLHLLTHFPSTRSINSRCKPKHPPRHLTPLTNIHIQTRRPRPLHPSRPAADDGELVRPHPPDIQQHVEDDQRRPWEYRNDAEEDLSRPHISISITFTQRSLQGRSEGDVRRSERPSSRRRLGLGGGWSTTPWLFLDFSDVVVLRMRRMPYVQAGEHVRRGMLSRRRFCIGLRQRFRDSPAYCKAFGSEW